MKCGDPNNPAGPFIKANGSPCQRDVQPGRTRCYLHGGSAPAAKIKAEQMMAQARMPAIEALFRIIEQFEQNPCLTCGFPTGDTDEKRMIIQACRTILDRTGMGPTSTVNVAKQTDGDVDLTLLDELERQQLREHLTAVRALKNAAKERQQQIVADPHVH